MELFEIYIAYISWGNDGKKRPVMIAELSEEIVSIYGITSKYETKSEVVLEAVRA